MFRLRDLAPLTWVCKLTFYNIWPDSELYEAWMYEILFVSNLVSEI